MRLNKLLESISTDRLEAIKKAAKANEEKDNEKFSSIRDTLSHEDIVILRGVANRWANKKAPADNVSLDKLESLQARELVNNIGHPTPVGLRFLSWLDDRTKDNRSAETKFRHARHASDDYLRRGALKRQGSEKFAHADPEMISIKEKIKNLSDNHKVALDKISKKLHNRRLSGLAKSWKISDSETVESLKSMGILDNANVLTPYGEKFVKFYIAFKSDPTGMERVPSSQQVNTFRQRPVEKTKYKKRMTKDIT